jgi:uncharacterized protein (TIGR02597 family)
MLAFRVLSRAKARPLSHLSPGALYVKVRVRKKCRKAKKIFDSRYLLCNFTFSMNILRPSIYAIALTSLALSGVNAQTTATTDPVGFTTLNVRGKANAGASNRNNFISLNMQRASAFQGVITSASVDGSGRSVLTISGATFTANQFDGVGNAHYVRLTSGSNAGQVSEVVATSANTITVVDNINDAITAGTTAFSVTPYWTLNTAFPSGAGLQGSSSAAAADTVTIIPPSGASLTYFYNSTANQWRRGTTDSSNVVIPPGSGMQIIRKQVGDVSIVLAGSVTIGSVEGIVGAASAAPRNSFLANPFPLASRTLAQSGLYTGNAATGVVGGTSAAAADTVTIFDPATGIANTYFYNTSANQWRRGTTDSSNVTIPDGAAIQITRKANRGEFSWFIPQPTMAL